MGIAIRMLKSIGTDLASRRPICFYPLAAGFFDFAVEFRQYAWVRLPTG
jgi:hypothetical protein